MALVRQLDKRTGITYVYESTSYWDKEKKQPRSHRRLIGRLDPETGDIVPTDGRGRHRRKDQTDGGSMQSQRTSPPQIRRLFYGATYLLDQISRQTGLITDLQACFPDAWRQILSLSYFMILENGNSFSRFGKWEHFHLHPYGQDISKRQYSALFAGLTSQAQSAFFSLQSRRFPGNNCLVFDIAPDNSSSHEPSIGFSPEEAGRRLPSAENIAFLLKESSGIPFCCFPLEFRLSNIQEARKISRNPALALPEGGTLCFIQGVSSFREDYLASFSADHQVFLWGVPVTWSIVKDCLHETMPDRDRYEFFHGKIGLYVFTRTVTWEYDPGIQNLSEAEQKNRAWKPAGEAAAFGEVWKLHVHLYCDPLRRKEEEQDFREKITRLRTELLSGHRVPEHGNDYRKYFAARETPDGRYRLVFRQDAIDAAREQFGMMALVSNEIQNPEEALRLYRLRETAQKALHGMENGFQRSETEQPGEDLENGFRFTEHVALAHILALQHKMEEAGMFAHHTVRGLLDELDMIECRIKPGGKPIPLRLQDTQDQCYQDLGLVPIEK